MGEGMATYNKQASKSEVEIIKRNGRGRCGAGGGKGEGMKGNANEDTQVLELLVELQNA